MTETPLKTCTGPCGRTLPATRENFSPNKKKSHGLAVYCKKCVNARHAVRLANETPEQRTKRLDVRKARRKKETPKQRANRLGDIKARNDARFANETSEQRAKRLDNQRRREAAKANAHFAAINAAAKPETEPPIIAIALPLPSSAIQTNKPPLTAGGRMARAASTKSYRAKAKAATLKAMDTTTADDEGREIVERLDPWPAARARLAFYWPKANRRDIRNAEAAMKAAYDGIVDAGLIPDDDEKHLTHDPTTFHIDAACPRVEIHLTRMEATP